MIAGEIKWQTKERKSCGDSQVQKVEILEALTVVLPGSVVVVEQLILRVVTVVHLHHVHSELLELRLHMIL
jgi:hypothetical protein